ncbi:MAG: hypothetical protein ABGX04_12290 [Myxococcales bacterium]|nr:hypothetical protein [Myxococcales bacterium]HIK85898.1 hypothetical protein [Myxococcales bacterium]
MAESAAFSRAFFALENEASFSRSEARGTIRLALKWAGLDAKSVTVEQLRVVLERLLPIELERRGVPEPEAGCRKLSRGLTQVVIDSAEETPEHVFSRLGGS